MTYSDTVVSLRDTDSDVLALQQRITAEVTYSPGDFDADVVAWREVTIYELALAATAEPLAQTREQTAAILNSLQQFAGAEMRCSNEFFAKFTDLLTPFRAELDALTMHG